MGFIHPTHVAACDTAELASVVELSGMDWVFWVGGHGGLQPLAPSGKAEAGDQASWGCGASAAGLD